MNNLKRFLALMLAMCMMLTAVPFGAFAAESDEQTEVSTESVTEQPELSIEAVIEAPESETEAADTSDNEDVSAMALTIGDKPADGTVTGQPFDTSVSANYRIPGLVNHNGTLIASADARWDYEKDGGGMDLVVSRSEDGNTWNYTFAGYLGDNGNVWNANSSTLMDPVIISDGNTLYLLADMFPAGYSISSSSTTNVFSDTAIGFDASGNLLLSADNRSTYGYYLKDGKIYTTAGEEQTAYTVDSWFNLYENNVKKTNLFFSDSPFQVRATSYICLLTSTDGGENWTNNGLLNVKPNGVEWMVLGPGSGVVTQDGNLAFTAYDNTNIYLVYGKDGQWNTVQTSAATNESSIIELNDGTIRAFVKRGGNNTIAYVDFTKTSGGYTAGSLVDTGVTNFSQCMVSSLHYSKTLNGKEVVLVCCPSKPGSGDWNGRFNGKIHMFTLDGSNNMTLVNSYALNSESQFFAYSNMAEMDDGTIAVLYEDDCISYSAGNYTGTASHITYTNVNLETAFNVTFDIMYKDVAWNADSAAGSVEVPVSSGVTSVYAQQAEVSSLTNYVAYDMHLCGTSGCTGNCGYAYTGAATVTLPLTEELKSAAKIKGFVVETNGSVTYIDDVQINGDTASFEVPHFSVVGLVEGENAVHIYLSVGESKTETIEDYGYTDADVAEPYIDTTIATLDKVEKISTAATKELVAVTSASFEAGKQYLIVSERSATEGLLTGSSYTATISWSGLQISGLNTHGTVSENSTEIWSIIPVSDDTYYVKYGDQYLTFAYSGASTASLTSTPTAIELSYTGGRWYFINDDGHYLSNVGGFGNGYYGASGFNETGGSGWTIYEVVTTSEVNKTEVTFTGKSVGNTSATIGHVTYAITVLPEVRDVTLHVGQPQTFTINGAATEWTIENSAVATLDSVVTKDASLVPVSEIVDGEYLIVNSQTGAVLTDTVVPVTSSEQNWGTKTGLDTTGTASIDSQELWTITATDEGYTVVQGGKYLTVAGFYANMSDTATNLTLTYTSSGWTIVDSETTGNVQNVGTGSYHLSDDVHNGYSAAALGTQTIDSYCYWDIYKIDTNPVTEVTFTGVQAGNTTATVGHVTFNITVDNVVAGDIEGFNNIVGVDFYSDDNSYEPNRSNLDMAGKVITSLRITEGATFHLGVDLTDYESVTWISANEAIATVDANGNVTAVANAVPDGKYTAETYVTATVVKDGVVESISIPVIVVPSMVEGVTETTSVFYYIEQVDWTDPYYTMFVSTENQNGPVEGHDQIMVSEGQVIWYERPKNSAFAWVWTADPWEGYALTYMASTGSVSQYYPLRDPATGELGESDYSSTTAQDPGTYYKYSISYKNIESVGKDVSSTIGANWRTAVDDLLNEAILVGINVYPNYGCDGAMSNTRWDHDGVPKLVTSMTFVSDPMPKITKGVNGILPTTKLRADFAPYYDGMTATVGEYVYFEITVTLERPTVWVKDEDGNDTNDGAIQYSLAKVLDDDLSGGYFYVQENDKNLNGVIDSNEEGANLQEVDITDNLNANWDENEQIRTINLYLVYEIQSNDIPKFVIDNTADLTWNYQSTYSTGSLAGKANAQASIIVVGHAMDNVVIDFGQTITYTGLTSNELKYASVGADVDYETKYGTVTVTGNGDPETTTAITEGTYYNSYTVTYTPTSILREPDVVKIFGTYIDRDTTNDITDGTEVRKMINSFVVYPATTVYYEEGFMINDASTGWSAGSKATMEQKFELLGKSVFDDNDTLTGYTSNKTYAYGYDPIYNGDGINDVAKSEIISNNVGDTTSFQFTGTGFELYANCNTGTGRVAVSVYKADGSLEQMYVVNTVAANGATGATAGQNVSLNTLPIVSVKDMAHGTYTVKLTKVVNDSKPVYIDGVRIINTVKDSSVFQIDLEDNPEFYQLRDYVLKAVGVDSVTDSMYAQLGENPSISQIADQIYAGISSDGEAPAAMITSGTGTYGNVDVQDLLDNGPKNELFLHEGETLTFSVKTSRAMQIGLKAPAGETSYSITGATTAGTSGTLKTSTDMFYALGNTIGTETTYTITVTNTGSTILSITDLKICDDPNAVFVPLTVEDIKATLVTMGYGVAENTTTGESFETVSAALTAAKAGETVKVLADCTESTVMVTSGVTLDLNGCKLTASYAVAMDGAHIVDNVGTGSMIIGLKNLILDEENAMIPVYNGEGYVFTKAGFAVRQDTKYTGEGFKIQAMAYPVQMAVVDLLKDGGADNNIEIIIRLTWDTDQGTGSQDFKFTDAVVASVYSSNTGSWSSYSKMFSMVVSGFESIENLKANIIVVSGTDAEYVSSTSVDIT